MGPKYRDENWLHEQYIEQDKTQEEIAEETTVGGRTICEWLGRHDIEKRNPWDYEEKLQELYWERGMSSRDIADHFGCRRKTIREAMDRHGVERRDRSRAHKLAMWKKPPSHEIGSDGYECVTTKVNGTKKHLYIHRLIAVAIHGFDDVKDKDVHHVNGVKWDNRHDNLELMTESEHRKHHWETEPEQMGRWS